MWAFYSSKVWDITIFRPELCGQLGEGSWCRFVSNTFVSEETSAFSILFIRMAMSHSLLVREHMMKTSTGLLCT
jgi:hypothetical protein